jgi:hypothetical protein
MIGVFSVAVNSARYFSGPGYASETQKAHIFRARDNLATKMTDAIPEDLRNVLGPNEEIQLYVEQKMYHPTLYVDSVAITNQRIILRHPHALGLKKDYTDFGYQDIANVVLERGVLRSTVKCMLRFGGEPLTLTDLPDSEAEKAYGIIRENLARSQAPSPSIHPDK